jgi:hypothetical protein
MSVDPLYLSGKYVLGPFYVSLMVKIDIYLPSTTALPMLDRLSTATVLAASSTSALPTS